MIRGSCFVMKLGESVRHLSGNESYSWERKREQVLTSRDVSSLVVDRLCNEIVDKTRRFPIFTVTSQTERSSL